MLQVTAAKLFHVVDKIWAIVSIVCAQYHLFIYNYNRISWQQQLIYKAGTCCDFLLDILVAIIILLDKQVSENSS